METEVIEAWSKSMGDFSIAGRTLRPLFARRHFQSAFLQPALHYELDQVSKIDILRKLKSDASAVKTIRDIRFRVSDPGIL